MPILKMGDQSRLHIWMRAKKKVQARRERVADLALA
jgi:hypothetical protein